MRSHNSLLSRASAVAVAVAAAGLLNMPVAHASSGGGCSENSNDGNFADRVCISAHDGSLLPDYYILGESGCTGAEFILMDATTNVVVQDLKDLPCGAGHYGPYAWSGPTNGHQYFSKLSLTIRSEGLNAGASPLQTFQR